MALKSSMLGGGVLSGLVLLLGMMSLRVGLREVDSWFGGCGGLPFRKESGFWGLVQDLRLWGWVRGEPSA